MFCFSQIFVVCFAKRSSGYFGGRGRHPPLNLMVKLDRHKTIWIVQYLLWTALLIYYLLHPLSIINYCLYHIPMEPHILAHISTLTIIIKWIEMWEGSFGFLKISFGSRNIDMFSRMLLTQNDAKLLCITAYHKEGDIDKLMMILTSHHFAWKPMKNIAKL